MDANTGDDFYEEDEPLEDVLTAFNRSNDEVVTVRPDAVAISVSSWTITEDLFFDNYVPQADGIRT